MIGATRRGGLAARRRLRLASLAAMVSVSPTLALAEGERPSLEGEYTLDAMRNLAGGLRRGGGVLHKLLVAGEAPVGEGWTTFASIEYVSGVKLSQDYVGDQQVVDNIEAADALTPYEAWVAYSAKGGRLDFRLGLIDLNRDFDVQEAGALFLNSSQGVGPDLSQTGSNGPSIFPVTGLAVTMAWRASETWGVKLGVFDGAPGGEADPSQASLKLSASDGALVIGEVERRAGPTTLRVGLWSYTAAYDAIDPNSAPRRDNWGGYALLEDEIVAARAGSGALRAWARLGFSNGQINPVNVYVGGGLVRDDVWRPGDGLGLAVAQARYSRPARGAYELTAAETTFELTYRFAITSHLEAQPNLQMVLDPSGDRHLRDVLVAGVRFKARLGWPGT